MSRSQSVARRLQRREREQRKSLKRQHERYGDNSVLLHGRELRVMSYTITEDRFEKPDHAVSALFVLF